jgi:ubiquinone/menaquinone biosynthesis C-methylase UbiE
LIARTYAPLVGFYYSIYARALDLQPEDEVLDVACGSGVFLRKHASHARRIAGLDHSEPMIDEALRQNRERVAAGTAEFVVGDVTALPWADGSFSVVTSNDVDCYPEKARPAMEEMYRVLRHGGRAAIEGDRRAMMEAVGFTQVSTRPILRGYDTITAGFKA